MRISDWSSDVCSSDLLQFLGELILVQINARRLRDHIGRPVIIKGGCALEFAISGDRLDLRTAQIKRQCRGRSPKTSPISVIELALVLIRIATDIRSYRSLKIGRASCRERVCQYV